MATTDGIVNAWATLRAAGCRGGPSDEESERLTLLAWGAIFRQVPDDELLDMALAHLADPAGCQWWPQPGLLIKHRRQSRQLQLEDGDSAFGVLMDMVQKRGWPSPPDSFSDNPSVEAAYQRGLMACGGWLTLCRCTYDQLPSMRAGFRSAFNSAIRSSIENGAPQLPGPRPTKQVSGGFASIGDSLAGFRGMRLLDGGEG